MTANTGVVVYSKTAANNASSDIAQNWAEGMPPSAVNDSNRGGNASIAKFRDDNNGSLQTSGTSTAYAVTTNQNFAGKDSSFVADYSLAFQLDEDCGAPVTLNVDGLGAKPLRAYPGVELVAGALKAGGIYHATYKTSNSGEWILHDVNPTIIAADQVATASIINKAVTYAKLQDVSATSRVLGRKSSGAGVTEELSLSDVLDFIGSATRGDILVRGASSWTRLALGASGAVITSDGTDASWGAQNYTKLATVTASNQSAVSFTSLIDSTYREYIFKIDNLLPASNGVSLVAEYSDDAGSSWKTSSYAGTVFVNNNSGGSAVITSSANVQMTQTGDVANSAGYGLSGETTLVVPSGSSRKIINFQIGYKNSVALGVTSAYGAGYWDGTAVITGLRFRFSSGNVASGTVTMYGIK